MSELEQAANAGVDAQSAGGFAAPPQSPGAPAAQPEPTQQPPQDAYARVPYSAIPKHYGRDWSAGFRDANAYRDLRTGNWDRLAEWAQANGVDALSLLQQLQAPPAQPAEPAPQPPAYPRPQGPQGYVDPTTGYWIPAPPQEDPLQQVYGRMEASEKKHAETLAALRQELQEFKGAAKTSEDKRKLKELRAAEVEVMTKAIADRFGITANPQKRTWRDGHEEEFDPTFHRARADLESFAVALRARRLGLDPDGDDPRYDAPLEREFIDEAAEYLAPDWKAQDQAAAERVADNQKNIPQAGVPAGPAGRPQKSTKEMTREEVIEEGFRQAEAEGVRLRR